MEGGKYLAQGSYGCVFAPNIIGTNYQSNIENISKIVLKENIDEEFKSVNMFKDIDPENKYLVYPIGVTNISDYDIDNQCELEECKIITDKIGTTCGKNKILEELNKHFSNIIQPNGGIDLYSYLKNKPSSKDITDKFLNLFKAVLLLNKNEICHRDIKLDNIVTNPTFRLIDFGLTTTEKNLKNKTHSDYGSVIYLFWPLDYSIIINNDNIKKPASFFKDYINDSITSNLKFSELQSKTEHVKNHLVLSCNIFIEHHYLPHRDNGTLYKLYEEIFNKLDCYSLGITFLMCMVKSNESFDKKLYCLAYKMINNNPFDRISIFDATIQFIEFTVSPDKVAEEI